jgi:acetyl-CoA acetyltransferase
MKACATTQGQNAAVSAKNHHQSVHKPCSQFRMPRTVDEVLTAAPITYLLTPPMYVPMSDGAVPAIACTKAGMTRIGADRSR